MSEDRDPKRLDDLIRKGVRPLEPGLKENLRRLARAVGDTDRSVPTEPDERDPAKGAHAEKERYTLDQEVGRGGAGVVYRGHDHQLDRTVAVKLLGEHYRDDPAMVARFVDEARINARLQHPGIVPVHEVGERNDRPFFTMKLVEGETLAAQLAARTSPDDDRSQFLRIFESVCQTIAYAHDRGVIHRDLKPSNVMVGAFGEVQVMDWGLAKVVTAPDASLPAGRDEPAPTASARRSITGTVMGTPAYMSPEQARGDVESLGPRTDVFSLGSILCELLTGAPAYRGDDASVVMRAAREGDLADARTRLAAVPKDASALRTLARACLSPEVANRPPHAGKVAAAVTAYFRSVEMRLRAAEVAEARARSRTFAAVVVAAAIALLAVGGWWVESNRRTRVAELSETVSRGLEDLRQATNDARGRTDHEPADDSGWSAVETVATQLARLSQNDDLSGRLRERAASACGEARTSAAAGRARATAHRRDRSMVARLDETHMMPGNPFDFHARIEAYAKAFRDYGLDPLEGDLDATVSALRDSPIRDALVAGLDGWLLAFLWAPHDEQDIPRHLRLLDIGAATGAGADPIRTGLRHVLEAPPSERPALLEAAADAVDVAHDTSAAIRLVAGLLVTDGEKEDAVALLEEAIAHHPDDFWLHFRAAVWLVGLEQDADALRHYEAVRALRPQVARTWVNIAALELRMGNRDAARRTITQAEKFPGDSAGQLDQQRADVWIALDEHERAIAALDRAAAAADKASTLYFVAQRFAKLNELDRSAAALRRAVNEPRERRPIRSYDGLGIVERQRWHLFAARDAYNEVLLTKVTEKASESNHAMLGHYHLRAYLALGLIHREVGNFGRALGHFQEATKSEEPMERGRALVGFATVSLERSQYAEAERAARKATAIHAKSASAQRALADALFGLARYRDAARAEAAAVAAGGKPRPAWQGLLRAHVTIDRNPETWLAEDAPFDDAVTPFAAAEVSWTRGEYARAVQLWRRGFGEEAHPERKWPGETLRAAGAAAHVDAHRPLAITWMDRRLDDILSTVESKDADYETLRIARRTMFGLAHSVRLRPLFDPAVVQGHSDAIRDRCDALAQRIRRAAKRIEKRMRRLEAETE